MLHKSLPQQHLAQGKHASKILSHALAFSVAGLLDGVCGLPVESKTNRLRVRFGLHPILVRLAALSYNCSTLECLTLPWRSSALFLRPNADLQLVLYGLASPWPFRALGMICILGDKLAGDRILI